MVAYTIRLSIAKLYVLALALGLAGFLPMASASDFLFRAYRAPNGWGGQPNWFDYLMPIVIVGMAVGSVGTFVWAVVVTIRPTWHPMYRRLAAFGPPRQVAAAIDAELRGEVVRIGKRLRSFRRSDDVHQPVYVTRSWALQFTDFRLRVARLEDVLWVRKAVFHGPVQVAGNRGADFFVEVKLRQGGPVYFAGREPDIDRLLFELVSRLPWVLSGTQERWEDLWQADRAKVLTAVEEQRQQVQAQPPGERTSSIEEKVRLAKANVVERRERPPRG